jgi:exonuclease SbcD
MKKPIAIIFNDIHLKTGNELETLRSMKHMVKYAVDNKISNLIMAGDLFDSRSYQRQSILHTCDRMITMIQEANLTCYMFPGNHDKSIYKSEDSFLDIYRYHPNIIFNKQESRIELGGVGITMIPFFSDDVLVPILEKAKPNDVLISHFEMNGSTNLGYTIDNSNISRKTLGKFKKTYLGHFHNHHEITKDIVHLPSFRPQNFGEDNVKGFSILHDDLSYELIEGDFRKYIKLEVDINKTNSKELQSLIKLYSNSEDSVRIEFSGDAEKLKALDKSMFTDTGISLNIKYSKTYSADDLNLPEITKTHSKTSVLESFNKFCEDKGHDTEEGKQLLLEFLKQ